MELNEEQKGLILQACQMQVTELFAARGDELVNIPHDLLTEIFNAGVFAACNALDAVIK